MNFDDFNANTIKLSTVCDNDWRNSNTNSIKKVPLIIHFTQTHRRIVRIGLIEWLFFLELNFSVKNFICGSLSTTISVDTEDNVKRIHLAIKFNYLFRYDLIIVTTILFSDLIKMIQHLHCLRPSVGNSYLFFKLTLDTKPALLLIQVSNYSVH